MDPSRAQGTPHSGSYGEYPQLAYSTLLKATFVELPAFERFRPSYPSDDAFAELQLVLLETQRMARRLDG